MRIEAFSEGKNLDDPEANEDQFLSSRGGYAVIDGVTDITGRRYEGMRTGRLASRIVQRGGRRFPDRSGRAAAAPEAAHRTRLGGAARRYARHGIHGCARGDPHRVSGRR